MVAIPNRRNLPPALGIIRSRTGSGRKLPSRNTARSPSRNSSIPTRSTMDSAVRPSTPAVFAPLLLRTRSHATNRNAGSATRLNRSSNTRWGSSRAQRCSLVWIPSTRLSATNKADSSSSVFTNALLAFQHPDCLLAGPLRPASGSPGPRWRVVTPATTTRPPPHPTALSRQRTCPRRPGWTAAGDRRTVPTFAKQSIGQGGAQLYSGSIATPTPQTFDVASPPSELHGFGVDPHQQWSCAAHRPLPARFEPASLLRSFKHWFTCVTPSDLAEQACTVWQSRHVPPCRGRLPPSLAFPRSGCPQASPGRCDGPAGTVSHPSSIVSTPRGAQLPREESRGRLQDLVGAAQLTDLAFQLRDPLPLSGRHAQAAATVDLGLPHPAAQRLGADAKLAGDPGDHPDALAGLLHGLQHHAHRPLTQLGRVAPLGRVGTRVVCHDSILPSKRWSLHKIQGESPAAPRPPGSAACKPPACSNRATPRPRSPAAWASPGRPPAAGMPAGLRAVAPGWPAPAAGVVPRG